MLLKNEFARVVVELDSSSKGPRLMIQDIRTKKKIYLDPLELESLAWCKHEDLHHLLDPSQTRWKDKKQQQPPLISGTNE
ncbi:hypothetical protein GNT69_15385 [Bacillus sp. B15-48]|nr:hypothetical protein [Bacillus sp. B15-48]